MENGDEVFLDRILLVFEASEVASECHNCEPPATNPDGIRHREAAWPFPEALPVEYRIWDSQGDPISSQKEMVFVSRSLALIEAFEQQHRARCVAGPTLRRAALVALGCAGGPPSPVEYLAAKRSVDAESRSQAVLSELEVLIRRLPRDDITVVDLGAGTLSMVQPVTDLVARAGKVLRRYVAIDSSADLLPANAQVETAVADVFAYAPDVRYDLVVANAFADLAEPSQVASLVARLGDIVYLPITFAGDTTLEPPLGGALDATALDFYRRHLVDVEGQYLDVAALEAALSSKDFDLAAKDASDWTLPLGSPFAGFIVDFVANAVSPAFLAAAKHPREARAGLAWTRKLRTSSSDQQPRILRAANVDLLFSRRART